MADSGIFVLPEPQTVQALTVAFLGQAPRC
jgi:hypothetical protein